MMSNTPMKTSTAKRLWSLFAGLCAFWLLAFVPRVWAEEFQMYVGEVKTFNFKAEIDRVAVGNSKLISYSFYDGGRQLDLVALKEGDTLVQVWLKDNQKIEHKFFVTPADSGRTSSEAAEALRNLPGIKVRQVGPNTLVEGRVSEEIAGLIDKVAGKYPDIINLTIKGAGESSDEAITILRMIPGITTRRVGKNLVVTGSVNADTKEALTTVQNKYPEIINLTVEKLLVDDPMIFMNVKITEFGKNALKNLGIKWGTTIPGPTAAYARDWEYEGHPSVSVWGNPGGVIPKGSPSQYKREVDGSMKIFENVRDPVGFFGIATMIASSINLAVTNGDALVLAEPTLSARSGGKAEFLAGGQIPIMVPQGDGKMSTEFKDYGITLNIEPKAGRDGAITSKVTAEVSSVDESKRAPGGPPGFLTRKAQTEVSLRTGQTLAISGLVNRSLSKTVDKVAGLGDIPIIGNLFRSTNFKNDKSELVIFITPHIAGAKSDVNKEVVRKAGQLREQFLQNIDKGPEILD